MKKCFHARRTGSAIAILVLLALFPEGAWAQGGPTQGAVAAGSAISGTVLDDSTGEPIIDAGVEVVGQNKKARTDVDGKFRIPIAPGDYQVRFFAAGYQSARVESVKVTPDIAALVDIVLKPETAAAAGEDVVEVVATAQKARESAQLVARQKADVVEDTIGAETFEKAPDSDAAEVVARVPAVTIRNDYVYVRGLGERYSSALLNGSRLPSTNPNKRVVPLNLFPADFIDSIAIIKSYTPNLPGDFSGGLVDINLASYPDTFGAKLGSKLGFNTNATFSKFDTYRKARQFPEFFGVDTVRELPSIFGDNLVQFQNNQEAGLFAAALENIWSPKSITAPPNSSVDFEVGNDFGDFGVELAAQWENKYVVLPHSIQRQFKTLDVGTPVVGEDFVYDFDTWETELGAILSSGYDINHDNRLNFRALYQRQTADVVAQGLGFREASGDTTQYKVTRLEYTQQDLAYGQLSGNHHVGDVLEDGLDVDWRTAYSRTTLTKPDTRTTQYTSNAGAPFQWDSSGQGAQRFFLDVQERMTDSAVDLGVPFRTPWWKLQGRFSTGPAYTYRERTSNLRRFVYRRGVNPPDFTLPPEQILDPANVSDGQIQFQEESRPTDDFDASEEIAGYYGMADVPILRDTLRFVGGVRVEYSRIRTLFDDPLSEFQGKEAKVLINTDPLPSASLVWTPLSDMNVRAGWSQTVARPEFRELSPVLFPEPLGLRPTVGNADLVETNITNYDLRWEWFFAPLELVSVGFFYKDLDKPIEKIVRSFAGQAVTSFDNSDTAFVYGFEFEGRKKLDFIADELQGFELLLNVTWTDSNSKRGERGRGDEVQTRTEGPLVGQSPFVINAILEYDHPDYGVARLLYNTIAETLDDLGVSGLPDIFLTRRDQLDFTWTKSFQIGNRELAAKFSVENILNDAYLWTQGDDVQQQYRTGATFDVGLSYRW